MTALYCDGLLVGPHNQAMNPSRQLCIWCAWHLVCLARGANSLGEELGTCVRVAVSERRIIAI